MNRLMNNVWLGTVDEQLSIRQHCSGELGCPNMYYL